MWQALCHVLCTHLIHRLQRGWMERQILKSSGRQHRVGDPLVRRLLVLRLRRLPLLLRRRMLLHGLGWVVRGSLVLLLVLLLCRRLGVLLMRLMLVLEALVRLLRLRGLPEVSLLLLLLRALLRRTEATATMAAPAAFGSVAPEVCTMLLLLLRAACSTALVRAAPARSTTAAAPATAPATPTAAPTTPGAAT